MKGSKMEYLDIVREAKESMEHIYMNMKQAGCFKNLIIRQALVEYHLLKTIGQLSVVLGDLEDDNNNKSAVSQVDFKEMPIQMQEMRIQ